MEEFIDWFADFWVRLAEGIMDALKTAMRWAVIVMALPIWLLPFVYWFIFVRKSEDDKK